MTILVDASALVAMLTREPEADAFSEVLDAHDDRLCCAIGVWEAARAAANKRTVTIEEAADAVARLLLDLDIRTVAIGTDEAGWAIRAHHLYGKGTRHPAKLNMGDCFAYACAKTNNAKLLYKGDDFSQTDMA